jgi:hypothetical protein
MKPMKLGPNPPDKLLQNIAHLVNTNPKLTPGARINFYLILHPDESIETGMVYSFGVRRSSSTTREVLGEKNVETIVQSINDWISNIQPTSKWTEDPDEADASVRW